MLTPGDIKKADFGKAGRGTYKSMEVDVFLDEVYASYTQLYKENGELIKKLQLLADRVESYRQDEDSIRSALLTAQRMADSILKEANDKSEQLNLASTEKARQMLDAAKTEAEQTLKAAKEESATLIANAEKDSQRMIENAKHEVTHEKKTLERMQKEVSAFRTQMMAQYKAHIELIDALPAVYEDDDEKVVDDEYERRQAEQAKLEAEAQAETEPIQEVITQQEAYAPNEQIEEVDLSSFEQEQQLPQELPEVQTEAEPAPPINGYPASRATKNGQRFGTLKFGDDYSLENDEEYKEETNKKKGFFKKK